MQDRVPPGRTGFSLLELLVVAGVIALLTAILLPSLARARRAATQVSCTSNLRQWGEAAQFYAHDNRGLLPRRGQGVTPTTQIDGAADWFNALPPLLRLKRYSQLAAVNQISRPGRPPSIWLCPNAVDLPGAYYWSYGMNMALSVEQSGQNSGLSDNVSAVGCPSIMVLFADAPGNYCSVFPSQFPGGYNPVPRHNGKVNVCFLDAHAAALRGDYIGVGMGLIEHGDVRWHPPGSTWNSAR